MQLRSIGLIAGFAILAGCAQMPSQHPPAAAPAAAAATPAVSRGVSEAIARHQRLAEGASRTGDLATAAVEYQVLTVLAPGDASYARELAATRTAIDKGVREQLAAGHAAMAAGDLDRAYAAMMRVLALEPAQPDAAKVLRDIDRRRLTRIQAERAAKVAMHDQAAARAAARAPQNDANDAFDVEQAIEIFRAGDTSGGMREFKAFVAANPTNRAARQRIGNIVAERAKELEDQDAREQALQLYEQAVALRGDAAAPWAARVPALKKTLSRDYLERGSRAYRTNIVQAISYFEASVRYDPTNTQASIKLREAKAAKQKLDTIK